MGNNAYSFGRYFECDRQSVLMSGYLGSIGFGFPAAMGAWAAAPDRKIVAVTGDGGFGQYLAEFTTAVKYGMPITHVLLNNQELGKIAKEQRAADMDVWQVSLHNPSFAAYRRAVRRARHPGRVRASSSTRRLARPSPSTGRPWSRWSATWSWCERFEASCRRPGSSSSEWPRTSWPGLVLASTAGSASVPRLVALARRPSGQIRACCGSPGPC